MIFVLGFGILIGYWIGKDSSKTRSPDQSFILQRIINALVFTAQAELNKAKSKVTKDALQRVIDAGYAEQNGTATPQSQTVVASQPQTTTTQATVAATQPSQYVQGPNLVQQTPAKQDLDNTSLLLYFGAFLFITSIGLFVGFSDYDGVLRTILVAVVAVSMYIFGFWLHENKTKLKEVGLTFVGIGMAAVPFVGLAAYYYMFDEEYGPAIWATMSAISLVVYFFTLLRIRNTFISYMLIASFVSLAQSSVSVIDGPTHYYAWAMIVVGILLQAISLISKKLPELEDSSAQSARILVPLTIMVSFLVIGSEGTWQLAVSLILGSIYYGLQYFVVENDKEMYSLGAHALLIGGLAVWAYSVNESLVDVSRVLLIANVLHIVLAAVFQAKEKLVVQRFYDVALVTAGISVVIGVNDSTHLTLAFVMSIVLGIIITVRTMRHDSFVLTSLAWVIFSIIAGQVYPEDSISNLAQAGLSFSFVLPALVLMHTKELKKLPPQWMETLKVVVVSLHAIAMIFSVIHGEYSVILVSLLAVVNSLMLVESLRDKTWANVAVLYSLVPSMYVVIAASDDYLRGLPLFTWSVISALAVNIFIAMRHKSDAARWASTAGWIALPFALGIEEIGAFKLSAGLQMWLYLGAAIALSVSRAIARGRLLASKSANLASMDRESSASYEVGLAIATLIATVLAFASTATTAESTLVIVLAGIIMVAGGTIIEREPQYVALVPFIAQVALLRLMEPYDSASWLADNQYLIHVYVLFSSAIALMLYAWTATAQKTDHNTHLIESIRDAAVVTSFIAPLSFVILGEANWMMPVTLLVAAAVLMHHQWKSEIGKREGIGFLALAGVFWLMFILGVRNPQAYTHVLAAVFGLYGYIRFSLKNQIMANQYWGYMLGVATIPLAIQALGSGTSAGIYGYWLLMENIAFFLIGIVVRNQLITKWGLYMATGTVLYMLRGLGWAVLAVLALVLIGIGAYRALNQPDEPNSKSD